MTTVSEPDLDIRLEIVSAARSSIRWPDVETAARQSATRVITGFRQLPPSTPAGSLRGESAARTTVARRESNPIGRKSRDRQSVSILSGAAARLQLSRAGNTSC